MTFREVILHQLEKRDKRERAWKDIIATNQRLLHQTIELQKRNQQLLALPPSNDKTVPGNQQQINDLDRRIRELHEERAEMYKSQSENAQRLVTMNELLRAKEEIEKRQAEEIKQLSDTKAALFQQCDLQTQQLREKNIGIQFIQDELATLRLEIITTEERSKKLEKENAQLLERWINKMNEEAEKMNEATQFYEGFLEQARTIGRTLRKSGGKWVMQPDSTAGSIQEVPNEKSQTSQRFVSSTLLPTHSYKKIVAHEGEIYCVHASSTGTMFATGATDKKIKIYDAKTGSVSQTLGGSLKTITSIDFNSTDTFVLGSSTDNSSRAWQLSTGRIKHTFTGHIGKVSAAKFTGDSHKIVTASHDRTLKVWDFQKGDCIRTIFSFSSCNDVCLMDADGFTLVSGHLDGNLRLWDTRTGKGIKELAGVHVGQITSVGIRPNTFTVLTNSRDNVLKLVDLRIYDTLQTYQADSFRNGINWSRACFSPDGCYIAAGSADGTLHIWNTETGKLKTTMKEHSDAICGVSWNPTGSFLYSADKNKTVHMWDTSLPTTA